ncbi:hypothetical protein H4R24_003318 [Coemansia sp. RSA 988]|nr:hypothetical protein H4R24_003318 [Coemansia sp. RSA 988]
MAIDASPAGANCFAAKVHPAAASGPYSVQPLARSLTAAHGPARVSAAVDVTKVHPASIWLASDLQPLQHQSSHGHAAAAATIRLQLRPRL